MKRKRSFEAAFWMLVIAALFAWIALSGCASMTPVEKLYWSGAGADLATTAYGLENCPDGREANPAMTLAGDGTAEVLLSGLILKAGYWALFRDYPKALTITGAIQFGVAGANMGTITGCE